MVRDSSTPEGDWAPSQIHLMEFIMVNSKGVAPLRAGLEQFSGQEALSWRLIYSKHVDEMRKHGCGPN